MMCYIYLFFKSKKIMTTFNKKGFSLIEIVMGLAILSVLVGTVAIQGFAAYKNALDQGIRDDLKTLSGATTMLMVANNNIAPCFAPSAAEWVNPTDGICKDSGYDYIQGQGTDAANTDLDEDSVPWERFTFNNVLIPSYMDKIPNARRGGQPYIYTKGIPTTTKGSGAFAYTAVLDGPKADKIIKENISIINTTTGLQDGSGNDTNTTHCVPSKVLFSKNKIPVPGDATAQGTNDTTQNFTYYTYAALDSTNGGLVDSSTNGICDLYSDGQGIQNDNFSNVTNGKDKDSSVSITVNSKMPKPVK